jgi:hypothetical protein
MSGFGLLVIFANLMLDDINHQLGNRDHRGAGGRTVN